MMHHSKSIDQLPLLPVPADYPRRKLPFLAGLLREQGPIFRLDWPNEGDLVYLAGPEANRLVLSTQRECFSHEAGWTPQIGHVLGRGLLNIDGEEHSRYRKLMNPAFVMAAMERYMPLMAGIIAERCRDWSQRGQVDLHTEMRMLAFDVAAAALAGFQLGPQTAELRSGFLELLEGQDSDNRESQARYIERTLRLRAALYEQLGALIGERRARPAGDFNDILSTLVELRDDDGQGLSDNELIEHMIILLIAGHETSATTAAWLLYLLSIHPDYLRRVREELDALLPSADTPITLATVREMRLLGNALLETGRLVPPLALVPRGVVQDVEFAGYLIPVGTPVILALTAAHWVPEYFPQPERFDPDRFAPPREEDRRTPYALATFGGGPRICIGVNFAQVEVRAIAAYVLRQWDLLPIMGQPVFQEYRSIIGRPPGGIPVRVRSRRS